MEKEEKGRTKSHNAVGVFQFSIVLFLIEEKWETVVANSKP